MQNIEFVYPSPILFGRVKEYSFSSQIAINLPGKNILTLEKLLYIERYLPNAATLKEIATFIYNLSKL